MYTATQTYTKTDVRRTFENFRADLQMLAVRTQAMELQHALDCGYDAVVMAQEKCLGCVDIQLRDSRGRLVKVHRYLIREGMGSDSARPGGNRWPCLPDGKLSVIVTSSNDQKMHELERSGKLKLIWSPSTLSTNYSGMREDGLRVYSSNGYGLQRNSFSN